MSTNTNNLKYLINWKQVSVELSGQINIKTINYER